MAVEGLEQMQAAFRRLPDAVQAAVRTEMEAIASETVDLIRRLVPRGDTGALAQSVGWTWGRAPAGTIGVASFTGGAAASDLSISIYAGGGKAFYARFVEFGTRPHSVARNASAARGSRQAVGRLHPGARAHPFFWPAIRLIRRTKTRRINAAARRAAREVWGS